MRQLFSQAAGLASKWNCGAMIADTPHAPWLPQRKLPDTPAFTIANPPTVPLEDRRISGLFVGPRGGRYLLVGGVRFSVPEELHAVTVRFYGEASQRDQEMQQRFELLMQDGSVDVQAHAKLKKKTQNIRSTQASPRSNKESLRSIKAIPRSIKANQRSNKANRVQKSALALSSTHMNTPARSRKNLASSKRIPTKKKKSDTTSAAATKKHTNNRRATAKKQHL